MVDFNNGTFNKYSVNNIHVTKNADFLSDILLRITDAGGIKPSSLYMVRSDYQEADSVGTIVSDPQFSESNDDKILFTLDGEGRYAPNPQQGHQYNDFTNYIADENYTINGGRFASKIWLEMLLKK